MSKLTTVSFVRFHKYCVIQKKVIKQYRMLYFILYLALFRFVISKAKWVDKMGQTLHSDWLRERSILPARGLPAVTRKKIVLFVSYDKSFTVQSRWLNIGLALIYMPLDFDSVFVHKQAKQNFGQDPAAIWPHACFIINIYNMALSSNLWLFNFIFTFKFIFTGEKVRLHSPVYGK